MIERYARRRMREIWSDAHRLALWLEVERREGSEETLLRELRLEMEKRRRLREIYDPRKELELELEIDGADSQG